MRLVLAVLAAAWLAGVHAQDTGRAQALRALDATDAAARRAAIVALAETGTMADTAALVKALRDRDEAARDEAEKALWRIWSRSGSAEVDALYQRGLAEMQAGDLAEAIATFSRVIEAKPDFAEGWNKRATLYFMTGDLRRSLADCDEVVKRNPAHFGALSGYAQIYARLAYYERALDYARRALAVNPNLEGMRRSVEMLEHLVEQRRKQTI
ncbi:MAG TPA: tetratricopeptide repeat protein [Casimicrobiaceae bacterium]|nr:tetratricopeptide repeat protein [Casimicrobiaceae bacterium]